MNVGITGGTGFMGSHLARRFAEDGHGVVAISRGAGGRSARGTGGHGPDGREVDGVEFVAASVADRAAMRAALADCDAVAYLAGINMARGGQTYEAVHVQGTEHVVDAAGDAGVSKLGISSFLRTRPDCGSAYHESKWAAEELVRGSGLDHTVLKPGVTYGPGDLRW